MKKFDRRRKYYLVLDCETATLPCVSALEGSARQKVAIAKPLIYDLGWQAIDRNGNVYSKQNFLISEIFSVPEVFNTAYYASKRPIYIDKLEKGEIKLTTWREAVAALEEDMAVVEAVGAYNSMFDFKKALPFTELYINQLYSANFHKWLDFQTRVCTALVNGELKKPEREFEPDLFRFRGKTYPLFDIWGLSCDHILNCDEYREMCHANNWQTASGKYFKTSAETAYRFVKGTEDFEEAHTALDDAIIESEIFALITKKTKNKWEMGITYFPFRILGTVESFEMSRAWRVGNNSQLFSPLDGLRLNSKFLQIFKVLQFPPHLTQHLTSARTLLCRDTNKLRLRRSCNPHGAAFCKSFKLESCT